MPYTVNVAGHVEGATADESKEKEAAIIEAVREFVHRLHHNGHGVTNASVSASHHGAVAIPLPETPPAAPEPPAEAG